MSRSSSLAAAQHSQDQPVQASGAAGRRDLSQRLRTGRDRPGPVPPCLPDGTGGHGLQASGPPILRRQIAALDQGEEPGASRLQPRAGSVRLRPERLGAGRISLRPLRVQPQLPARLSVLHASRIVSLLRTVNRALINANSAACLRRVFQMTLVVLHQQVSPDLFKSSTCAKKSQTTGTASLSLWQKIEAVDRRFHAVIE